MTELLAKAPTVLTGPKTGRFRRNFIPIKNDPGELQWIDKRLIHIDPEYQRKLNDRLVARIGANWSWVSCGAISVSRRSNAERFFAIDGQHRWKAATYINWITELPCIVFQLDTVMDEATGFLAANTERRVPTLADQFRALITTGDKTALEALRLADSCGRKISAASSATTVSCVSDFLNCLNANTAAMHRVFPVIARVCNGRAMTGRMIKGMHALERRMPQGQSLSDQRWSDRLARVGFDELSSSMKFLVQLDNRVSEQILAQGILRAINYNLRQPLQVDFYARPR